MAPNHTTTLGYQMNPRMWKCKLENSCPYIRHTLPVFMWNLEHLSFCLLILPLPKCYIFICRNTLFQEKCVPFIIQLLITRVKRQEPWEGRKKNHSSFSVALLLTALKYRLIGYRATGIWWNKVFHSNTESSYFYLKGSIRYDLGSLLVSMLVA